ncbi:SIMPL domain-containing protein [Streptomyces polyrhachis]|uniref:SIMPL domain-containing protein n=1 Tax=Streptomyces polyrhachis TaxID=1282885 RepID=A0ABW2G9N8_9ACTN
MSTVRRIATTALGTALGAALLATPAVAAPSDPPAAPAVTAPAPATVSLTGSGSSSQAPDLALLSAGVEVVRPTATEAMTAQNTAAGALLEAVRELGVEERDVRTEGLSLGPTYDYSQGAAKLVGYQAAQTFTIKVRTLDRVDEVIAAVTAATGDAGRIHGVSFDVADRRALAAEARDEAFDEARAKAQQYADLSGRTLGRLVSVSEHGSGGALPQARPMDAAAPAPVAPGEVTYELTVSVVYELS